METSQMTAGDMKQEILVACLVVSIAGVVVSVLIPAVQVHARSHLDHVVRVHISDPAYIEPHVSVTFPTLHL